MPGTPQIQAHNGERQVWIEYAKGLAIIMVAYRHAVYGLINSGQQIDKWVEDLNTMFFPFRMPLFFLLSGLFFGKSLAKRGPAGLLKNKAATLLYPYFLWSIIQISLQIVFSQYANAHRSAYSYLEIIIQPRELDQLWYLFGLFNVTMLFIITSALLRIPDRWQLAIGLGMTGLAPIVQPWSALYDITFHYGFFAVGNAFSAAFLGGKVRAYARGPVLLATFPVFVALMLLFLRYWYMNVYLYTGIAFAGSMYVILLAMWIEDRKILGFLRTIGHYSLYIYLLHIMIIAVIRKGLAMTGWHLPVNLELIMLIVLGIYVSIGVYKIMHWLRLDWMFSATNIRLPWKPAPTVKSVV